MRNAPKIDIVVYLESYEYFTILGDFFENFPLRLLCPNYRFTAGFPRIFCIFLNEEESY